MNFYCLFHVLSFAWPIPVGIVLETWNIHKCLFSSFPFQHVFKGLVNRCAQGQQVCGLWALNAHMSDFNGQHMEPVSDERHTAGDRCWVICGSDPCLRTNIIRGHLHSAGLTLTHTHAHPHILLELKVCLLRPEKVQTYLKNTYARSVLKIYFYISIGYAELHIISRIIVFMFYFLILISSNSANIFVNIL